MLNFVYKLFLAAVECCQRIWFMITKLRVKTPCFVFKTSKRSTGMFPVVIGVSIPGSSLIIYVELYECEAKCWWRNEMHIVKLTLINGILCLQGLCSSARNPLNISHFRGFYSFCFLLVKCSMCFMNLFVKITHLQLIACWCSIPRHLHLQICRKKFSPLWLNRFLPLKLHLKLERHPQSFVFVQFEFSP